MTTPQKQKLLVRVLEFYHKTLTKNPSAIEQLNNLFPDHEGTQFGYSNGTLLDTLPQKGKVRTDIQSLGIIDAGGTELFKDCIFSPVYALDHSICGLCGINNGKQTLLLLDGFKPVPISSKPKSQELIFKTKQGMEIRFGSRHYKLSGIDQPSESKLKATIRATKDDQFCIDTLDLYSLSSRKRFQTELVKLFDVFESTVEKDIRLIITHLESYVQERKDNAENEAQPLTEDEIQQATTFAKSPNLLERITEDINELGLIGEDYNKLVGYLVMTSRKMGDPLALHILSGSGAGKSHLQDSILKLCPKEDLIKLYCRT